MLTLEGRGVESEPEAARLFLGKACQARDPIACELMVEQGWATRSKKPPPDAGSTNP
jgi:hypothetical protein